MFHLPTNHAATLVSRKKRKVRHLLIIDLDNTTVNQQKIDKEKYSKFVDKYLSPELLRFACRNLNSDPSLHETFYDNFYICTHRCLNNFYSNLVLLDFATEHDVYTYYANTPFYQNRISKLNQLNRDIDNTSDEPKKEKMNSDRDKIYNELQEYIDCTDSEPNNYFIFNIIENLENKLKNEIGECKCIAVSTPDDGNDECGSGYKEIIELYERKAAKEKRIKKESRYIVSQSRRINTDWTDYPSPEEVNLEYKKTPVDIDSYDHDSKNKQILSIVADIVKRFGTVDDFILDFVDDVNSMCQAALTLNPELLPENIILRVYRARASRRETIKYLGFVQGRQPVAVVSSSPSLEDCKSPEVVTPIFTSSGLPVTVPVKELVSFFSTKKEESKPVKEDMTLSGKVQALTQFFENKNIAISKKKGPANATPAPPANQKATRKTPA